MDRAGIGDDIQGGVRERWLFEFRLNGDLRFISHRDTMRLFQRALARTGLPVRFTSGFNPHPRLALPFPRPVGMASDAEVAVIDFSGPVDGQDAHAKLSGVMPAGIDLAGARKLAPGEQVYPVGACYSIDVSDRPNVEIELAVRSIVDAETIEITRTSSQRGASRTVDARAFVVNMKLNEDTVEFELSMVNGGGVKPAEIASLLGYEVTAVNHRIKRMETKWNQQPLKKAISR